jgi:predicted AAA+ superfamily ATPase
VNFQADASYIERVVDTELDELLPALPAISLEGPKAVGKTRTARRRAETVWELDDPAQRATISADPNLIADGKSPILIDEWQRVPETWDIVRREVDRHAEAGGFLLTGSATPTERPTHSGAGRIERNSTDTSEESSTRTSNSLAIRCANRPRCVDG